MIKYDLKCEQDHRFEGWFRNSASFDEQRDAGEIACPECGTAKVEKAIMAPRLPGKANAQTAAAVRKELAKLREAVERDCDYVGPGFAEEARKIHYGETEARSIYGETTSEDAKALADEGVGFARIPWVPKENA